MPSTTTKPILAILAYRKLLSGSVLLGIGVFLIIAFSGAFELVLLALGGILALFALGLAAYLAARQRGWRNWVSALGLALIGAALLIHEFVPAGDIIHGGATIASFGLGGFQIFHGVRERKPTSG